MNAADLNLILRKVDIIINSTRRLIPQTVDLADLRQDVLLAAVRCRRRHDASITRLNTYLERRIKGAIHDHVIKHNKNREILELKDDISSYESDIYKVMLLKEIYNFLKRYPEKKRLALKLWLKGLASQKIIASQLGVSDATFWIWKNELIKNLKKFFQVDR